MRYYNFGNALYNSNYYNLNLNPNDYELQKTNQGRFIRVAFTARQGTKRKERADTVTGRSARCSARRLLLHSLVKRSEQR